MLELENSSREDFGKMARANRKLTSEQVKEIRRRHFFADQSMRSMAKEFEVSEKCIRQIVHFITYRD